MRSGEILIAVEKLCNMRIVLKLFRIKTSMFMFFDNRDEVATLLL